MRPVSPAAAHHRLLLALTLAVPAAFAAAWVWLLPGGVVAEAAASEQRDRDQALAAAVTACTAALHAAATEHPVALQLDASRRIVGPFATPQGEPDAARLSIAEQAAGARLTAGDLAGALPLFAHAAGDGSLSPEGSLHYASLLAAHDGAAARRELARATTQHATAQCGGMPFGLLAALTAASWPATPDDATPEQQKARVLELVPAATAAAVPPLLDAIRKHFPDVPSATLEALRAAADAAITHRDTPGAAALPSPGRHGSVLVPRDDGRLAALPAVEVARVRDLAFAATAPAHPDVALHAVATDAPADASTIDVPALGVTWAATPAHNAVSSLLRVAAHTSLGLAVLTLVAGNLLLWRLTRRELALVRLRTDFVDVVSHELRTPLTALSLKAEMLAAGDVPAARVQHYLQTLHGDVRRLAEQVDRILDFGRLDRSGTIRREPLPGRTVLARGLRAGRPALRLVGQQVEVDAARTLPTVHGDVDVLARALRNLLENAAKYAPAGSCVTVRAFARDGELVIEVADRGPGVPASERDRIFQPFVRGAAVPGNTAGSGIGLALVAAAARLHAGRVEVQARDGGGAVFTLRLPGTREEAS